LRLGKSWLALPLVAFFLMFVALPVVMLLAASVSDHGAFTLSNFERFLSDGLSVPVLGRTLLLGLETAAVTLMLGYPLALLFVGASPGFQKLLILLIIQPLLTSAVVRTFAWVVILGRQGLINETLLVLGLTKGPIALLYTEPMLVVTLAQIELPIMTLPIISAPAAIDPALREASAALEAGPLENPVPGRVAAQSAGCHRRAAAGFCGGMQRAGDAVHRRWWPAVVHAALYLPAGHPGTELALCCCDLDHTAHVGSRRRGHAEHARPTGDAHLHV